MAMRPFLISFTWSGDASGRVMAATDVEQQARGDRGCVGSSALHRGKRALAPYELHTQQR
jgi:hypothetical protein